MVGIVKLKKTDAVPDRKYSMLTFCTSPIRASASMGITDTRSDRGNTATVNKDANIVSEGPGGLGGFTR